MIPAYDSGLIQRRVHTDDEFDIRLINDLDIGSLQGGIHCADDIDNGGWMFSMETLLGHTRFI